MAEAPASINAPAAVMAAALVMASHFPFSAPRALAANHRTEIRFDAARHCAYKALIERLHPERKHMLFC
jgi:hypothetical protein